MLQALIAREPAEQRPSIRAWLPDTFLPPQVTVIGEKPSIGGDDDACVEHPQPGRCARSRRRDMLLESRSVLRSKICNLKTLYCILKSIVRVSPSRMVNVVALVLIVSRKSGSLIWLGSILSSATM